MKIKVPNFSLTRGELPPDVVAKGRARNLGKRLRALAGWGALGLGFFVLFAWLALPTKAIAWRIGHEARKAGYKVDIEDVSVYPWGTVTLHDVTWTYEPSRAGEPPLKYMMPDVDVSVGLFSLMVGDIDVAVETEREDDGRIWARYERSSDESTFEIDVESLALYDVPKATQALGVPLMGLLAIEGELTMPQNKWSKAKGEIKIECSSCRAGDGDSKLYVPGSKNLSKDGITLPEIDLGTLTGKLVVEDGTASFEEPIESESNDLKLSLTGDLRLKDPFRNSSFDMIFKIALSEELQERSERLAFMYKGASPKAKLDPPEEGLGFRLEGVVARPRFKGIKTPSRRDRLEDRRRKQREREAKRRQRRAKREARKNKNKNKREEPEENKEPESDDKPFNIEPIDEPEQEQPEPEPDPEPEPEPEPEDDRPALPPPDEGDDIEVFDPNEPAPDDGSNFDPNDPDADPNQDDQGTGGDPPPPT